MDGTQNEHLKMGSDLESNQNQKCQTSGGKLTFLNRIKTIEDQQSVEKFNIYTNSEIPSARSKQGRHSLKSMTLSSQIPNQNLFANTAKVHIQDDNTFGTPATSGQKWKERLPKYKESEDEIANVIFTENSESATKTSVLVPPLNLRKLGQKCAVKKQKKKRWWVRLMKQPTFSLS